MSVFKAFHPIMFTFFSFPLKGGEWIRVAGELVEDDRAEARQSMLDAYPELKKMYAADDGNTEVFYFKNGVATISSFTHEPKVIKF